MNLCRSCSEDFASVDLFDRIEHEPVETYANGVRHVKIPDPVRPWPPTRVRDGQLKRRF